MTSKSGVARNRAELARNGNDAQSKSREDATPNVTLSDEQPAPGHTQTAGAERSNFRHGLLDQAEFASANLSRASFNHANLAGADLTEANLREASLRFATAPIAGLAAADLSRADLQLACFDQANLAAANLSGAALDHADFLRANLANANLKGASLRFATLKEARLDRADLSGADLRYARLNEADLTAANLSGSHLDYANFSGASLADANLCGAHLRYAKNLTPEQLEQARTDESTIRPFHYLELPPLSQTSKQMRRRNRPLMVAGVLALAGIAGVFASVDLIRQRQASYTTPGIVPPPNATPILASPILASLTPSTSVRLAYRSSGQRSPHQSEICCGAVVISEGPHPKIGRDDLGNAASRFAASSRSTIARR